MFKRFLVKYLNLADHNLARIAKADKDFAKKFKDIKFSVEVRDIHKTEKKNPIDISVFGYENKEKHPIYVSKKFCEEKYVDLSLIDEKKRRLYALIKDLILSCMIILYIV